MLEVLIKFICAFIFAILGYYIIKKINNYQSKIKLNQILLLIINSILITIIHIVYLNFLSSLVNYIINTLTYKKIFNQQLAESIIETGIISLLIISTDALYAILLVNYFHISEIQNNLLLYLICNAIIAMIVFIIINIKIVPKKLHDFSNILLKKDLKFNGLFIGLIMISISGLVYKILTNYNLNYIFLSDMLIIGSLIVIVVIFINNKDTYNKLSNEYDILLSNVQTFEEWIEKEQFTRHEYKNQLAVLYALSSEKEVKNKIEEIINQNLNIQDEIVNNLKDLPRGGLKGLLYYKTIIAEKSKLNITVNVSIKEKGILQKLNKKNTIVLAKIVGILYDNAIDAAEESRKKNLLLEIYELKDKINIVISNTFKKSSIVENRFEKGTSSKGKGHGNGLYYLNKILKENYWIEEKQEIIDNYYVETITIKKNTSKK